MTVNPSSVHGGAGDEGICFYLAIDISEYCTSHQNRWGYTFVYPCGQLQWTGIGRS